MQQPAAPVRTGATALLAATAIWSTDDSAPNSTSAVITTAANAATARVPALPPSAVAAPTAPPPS
ncbi:MAG: hypothetical protein WCB02_37170, partial [Bradyrhizobium sp.]